MVVSSPQPLALAPPSGPPVGECTAVPVAVGLDEAFCRRTLCNTGQYNYPRGSRRSTVVVYKGKEWDTEARMGAVAPKVVMVPAKDPSQYLLKREIPVSTATKS